MSGGDLTDMRGARFEDADLHGAVFTMADLTGSRFRAVGFHGVVMRGVEISDTTIDGDIEGLVINGVDVGPLVEAELDRRNPDRVLFRPTTADGFRQAWDVNERLWATTVDRARRLPPERLHESVDEEWSFIETLRHLAFASESWVGRAILGDPTPCTPCHCRGTRCGPGRVCLVTARRGRRSTRPSPCGCTRWRWSGGWSTR